MAAAIGGGLGLLAAAAMVNDQKVRDQIAEMVIDPLTIGALSFALVATPIAAGLPSAQSAARLAPSEALRA